MSNVISYSLGRCSAGESYDFSRSAANDVSGNTLSGQITFCNNLHIPQTVIETRWIDLDLTLTGWDENVGYVSTPPRKFRKSTLSGDHIMWTYLYPPSPDNEYRARVVGESIFGGPPLGVRTYFPPLGGTYNVWRITESAGGSVDWIEATFITSATHSYQKFYPGSGATPPGYTDPPPYDQSLDVVNYWQWGSRWHETFPDRADYASYEVLSDECTEAVAFAEAAALGTWSEWAEDFAEAAHELRTSGFEFREKGVEYRIYTPPLGMAGTPNHTFTITLTTEQRAYGSTGTWIPGSSIVFTTDSDENGFIDVSAVKLDCPAGLERRISGITVVG